MSGINLDHINCNELNVAPTCQGFLRQLGSPTVLHLDGENADETRVVITLLHGNEPSGFRAFHHMLRNGFKPYCNTKVIIASVVAARTEPMFTHRMLPGQRDLNRCFAGPYNDPQGALAAAIAEYVESVSPSAVIDLHNTSGSGPSFAVSTRGTDACQALASHFTQRIIFTDIRLGSAMEREFGCPIITIEAGGAEDEEANVNALLGLQSFLGAQDPLIQLRDMETLTKPKRLELHTEASLQYAEGPIDSTDITMRQDIEKHNFGVTTPKQKPRLG